MDAATVAGWGQNDAPTSAVATFPASHVPSSPPTASDWQYAAIQYYDANGREVNTASYTGGAWTVTTTQYDTHGNSLLTLSALAGELAGPAAAGLTACELEDLLDERGREVVRQLLQDHFDLRRIREEQQARETSRPGGRC